MKRVVALVIVVAVCLAAWTAVRVTRRGGTASELRVSGMVDATTVDVGPEIAGTVVRLLVDEGEVVRRGQLIAALDADTWAARLEAAQAQAQQAGQRALEAETAVGVQSATSAAAIAQAKAAREAAANNLTKLRHGSRPQEIEAAQRQAGQAAAAVGSAEGAAQAAQQQVSKLRAGSRPQEIEQARAASARARAQAQQAQRDWERMRDLAAQGAVSAQAAEVARTGLDAARAQAEVARQQLSLAEQGPRSEDIAAAEAELRRAQAERRRAGEAHQAALAQLSLVREGPRREDVQAATAELARAEGALAGARAQSGQVDLLRRQAEATKAQQRAAQAAAREASIMLDKTRIFAPLDSVIQKKIAEASETVNPGSPIVRIVNLDDLWLTVYAPETEIGRLRIGQGVEVTVDSYPGRSFRGTIEAISSEAEFTPKYVQTPDERTRLVYAVKVRLDNRERIFKPGMPADALIHLQGREGKPPRGRH